MVVRHFQQGAGTSGLEVTARGTPQLRKTMGRTEVPEPSDRRPPARGGGDDECSVLPFLDQGELRLDLHTLRQRAQLTSDL